MSSVRLFCRKESLTALAPASVVDDGRIRTSRLAHSQHVIGPLVSHITGSKGRPAIGNDEVEKEKARKDRHAC